MQWRADHSFRLRHQHARDERARPDPEGQGAPPRSPRVHDLGLRRPRTGSDGNRTRRQQVPDQAGRLPATEAGRFARRRRRHGRRMTAHILVVDDEPDLELLILQRFRRQIRDSELKFTFADDGVDALAKLYADPDIDMLLCDINMPRMDGLTLLGRLQEREGHLATVIVSAYGDMANIRTAMNRGAFDFVTKPIDFIDLE